MADARLDVLLESGRLDEALALEQQLLELAKRG